MDHSIITRYVLENVASKGNTQRLHVNGVKHAKLVES